MRTRRKEYISPESLFQPKDLELWEQIAKNRNTRNIKANYRSPKVVEELTVLHDSKCAYCESHVSKFDIEHYRPKGKVAGAEKNNHGYYWLCYEWSNLLPSCSNCNESKGAKFPIKSIRVTAPKFDGDGSLNKEACKASCAELLAESPMLLHPEIEEVEGYFCFDATGQITGTDSRAKETISVCALSREDLVEARREIIEGFIRGLKDVFTVFEGNFHRENHLHGIKELIKRKINQLFEKTLPSKRHSLMALYCFWHLKDILLEDGYFGNTLTAFVLGLHAKYCKEKGLTRPLYYQ